MNISNSWHQTWLIVYHCSLCSTISLISSHFQQNRSPLIRLHNQITWVRWIKGFSSHISYWQNCTTLNSYATTSCKLPWDQAAETCTRFHTTHGFGTCVFLSSLHLRQCSESQLDFIFLFFFLDSKAVLQKNSVTTRSELLIALHRLPQLPSYQWVADVCFVDLTFVLAVRI